MRSFFLALALAVVVAPVARAGGSYAIIADDDLPIYRTVVTGIAVEATAPVDEYSLGGDVSLGPEVVKRALEKEPAVVIAVGPKAANAAKKAVGKTPLVYCMVPRPENYRLSGGRVVGVRLERSYAAQLEALKAILPDVNRVAVVYDPSRSSRTLAEARRAADKLGLSLVPVEIRTPAEAATALAKGAGDAQAMWMISDPTVLNLQTFEAMLAFASEQKLPFFALNAGFVERGALFSFSVDYARLGRQVGKLANRMAEGGPEKGGMLPPEETELAVNLSTAEAMGSAAELYARVLAYAADHKHAVRVYR